MVGTGFGFDFVGIDLKALQQILHQGAAAVDNDGRWDKDKGGTDRDMDNDGQWDE